MPFAPQGLPKFRSLTDTAFTGFGYSCTNEAPEKIRELLKGRVFKRVAAICSGGEMPLLVFLPRTTKEVVAVDHAKRALLATYMKVLLLDKYGPKEAKEILTTLHEIPSQNKVKHISKDVPEEMLTKLHGGTSWDPNYRDYPELVLTQHSAELKREWGFAREQDIKATVKKLHLLKLVHGDISDLKKEFAPFEMFYFSNAFEHNDRNGKLPDPREIEKVVVPGGLILTSAQNTTQLDGYYWAKKDGKPIPLNWKVAASIKGIRGSWIRYDLHSTPVSFGQRLYDKCNICGLLCEAAARKERISRVQA